MTLVDITNAANSFADENYETTLVKHYVNTAISIINNRMNSELPFIDDSNEYIALSDSWVMSLLVTYATYGIKMNDGSLNEADNYLMSFESAMRDLENNKLNAIADKYRGEGFSGIYKADLSKGINVGWFGGNR